MAKRTTLYLGVVVALTGVYFCAGKLGLALALDNPSASAVWPPTGLALAAVLLLGYRVWPAVLMGSLLLGLTTAKTFETSLMIAAGNTLEAVVGAMLARRFAGGAGAFEHAEDIVRFVAFAAIPSTALSATVGVTTLANAGLASWGDFLPIWLTWWTGNFVSDLTFAPLLLIWAGSGRPALSARRWVEAAALMATVCASSLLIFGGWLSAPAAVYSAGYVALLPLLWASFRFHQPGAITAALVLFGIATWGTLEGYGPFQLDNVNLSLLLLQSFIGVAALMALIPAAVVADRAMAERALRDHEQHLTMALSSGRMGTWEWDIASGRVAWSSRLEEIHGLRAGEFAGTFEAFLADVHPADVKRVMDTISQALARKGDCQIEYRLKRRDGQLRWVEGRGRIVADRNGIPQHMVGVCMDVTDRNLAESERESLLNGEREARREAEHASQAKDQFLAMLSHELRTPLTPVMLTASSLECSEELPEKFRADMRVIRRNIDLEARLIDDLLDLTRSTHGKLDLDLQTTDVHELVRQVADICCPKKDCQIETDLGASRALVHADPARLQQVLWNLLSNAMKFAPRDSRIRVSTRNDADQLAIEIKDCGPGIEPELMARLFRPFEQGQAARIRGTGGLGLGLAISQALIAAHGGQLEALSNSDGGGATFVVTLPVAAPEPADVPPLQAGTDGMGTRPLRILLVEDHDSTRAVMRKLLADHGHDVTATTCNADALGAAERDSFDLLISDLGLPDGFAYDLMNTLRQRWGIRGIALSGYGTEADVARALESGFAEHLTKPVDMETLLRAIDRVANSSAAAMEVTV